MMASASPLDELVRLKEIFLSSPNLEDLALEAVYLILDENEFRLREMLDAAVGQPRAKAAANGLPLTLSLEADLPETVTGDALRVRELLGHLIANAIKAARPAPRTTAGNAPAILLVNDNAVGQAVIRHTLQRRGARVECACSARGSDLAVLLQYGRPLGIQAFIAKPVASDQL